MPSSGAAGPPSMFMRDGAAKFYMSGRASEGKTRAASELSKAKHKFAPRNECMWLGTP